jgi:hypothetical protein
MSAGGNWDGRWVRAGAVMRSWSDPDPGFVASIAWSNRSEAEWSARSSSASNQISGDQKARIKQANIQHKGAEIAEITEKEEFLALRAAIIVPAPRSLSVWSETLRAI